MAYARIVPWKVTVTKKMLNRLCKFGVAQCSPKTWNDPLDELLATECGAETEPPMEHTIDPMEYCWTPSAESEFEMGP